MAKNNITVTFCVPTYNRAHYLPETLDSILQQTYKDFELLVINDGSTDSTNDVLKGYNDKRLKYIKNSKNMGYIKTMNKGTNLAKGDWIMHVSDDDRLRPTMLEEMIKSLSLHTSKKIGLVVPQSANINEKGELISEPDRQLGNKKYLLLKPKEFIFNFTLYGKKIRDKYTFNTSFPSTLFNKKILIELGMSSEDVPVSHDILIESMICLLHPVLIIDDVLFEYRVHANWGSSLNSKGTFLKEYITFLQKLFSFISTHDISFDYDFHGYAYNALVSYIFSFNGGLIRTAGKFQGSYRQRLKKIVEYCIFGITLKKQILLQATFYLVVIASLLPQSIILLVGRILRKA